MKTSFLKNILSDNLTNIKRNRVIATAFFYMVFLTFCFLIFIPSAIWAEDCNYDGFSYYNDTNNRITKVSSIQEWVYTFTYTGNNNCKIVIAWDQKGCWASPGYQFKIENMTSGSFLNWKDDSFLSILTAPNDELKITVKFTPDDLSDGFSYYKKLMIIKESSQASSTIQENLYFRAIPDTDLFNFGYITKGDSLNKNVAIRYEYNDFKCQIYEDNSYTSPGGSFYPDIDYMNCLWVGLNGALSNNDESIFSLVDGDANPLSTALATSVAPTDLVFGPKISASYSECGVYQATLSGNFERKYVTDYHNEPFDPQIVRQLYTFDYPSITLKATFVEKKLELRGDVYHFTTEIGKSKTANALIQNVSLNDDELVPNPGELEILELEIINIEQYENYVALYGNSIGTINQPTDWPHKYDINRFYLSYTPGIVQSGEDYNFKIIYKGDEYSEDSPHEAFIRVKYKYGYFEGLTYIPISGFTYEPEFPIVTTNFDGVGYSSDGPVEGNCYVKNDGSEEMTLTGITLSNNAGGKLAFTDNNYRTIGSGETIALRILYYPGAIGTHTGEISFRAHYNDYYRDIKLPISGTTKPSDGKYLSQTKECSWDSTNPEDELVKLTSKLENDPLKIFTWVYENIDYYDSYDKARQKALQVFHSGSGNQWDISTLLITLFRISGYEARYVHIPDNKNWYDDKVFVEVKLNSQNYGVSTSDNNSTWVPLAPWYKDEKITYGTDIFESGSIPWDLFGMSSENFADNYLETFNSKTLLEIFEEKIQEWLAKNRPGKSIQNIVCEKTLNKSPWLVLPRSLPEEWDISGKEAFNFAEVPDEQRLSVFLRFKKHRLSSSDYLNKKIAMSDITGNRLFVKYDYEKDNNENITGFKSQLILDDIQIKEADGYRDIEYEGSYVIAFNIGTDIHEIGAEIKVGSFLQMGFDHLCANRKTVEKMKAELQGIDLADNTIKSTDYLSRMGNILLTDYHLRLKKADKRLLNLLNSKVNSATATPLFLFVEPETIEGDAESKFLIHPGWKISAHTWLGTIQKLQTGVEYNRNSQLGYLRRLITGYTASYNESRVFEDWQDTPALSTVKGFMVANDEDISIHEFKCDRYTDIGQDACVLLAMNEIENFQGIPEKDKYGEAELELIESEIRNRHKVKLPAQKIHYNSKDETMFGSVLISMGDENYDAYLFNMGKTPEEVTNGGESFTQVNVPIEVYANLYIDKESKIYIKLADSYFLELGNDETSTQVTVNTVTEIPTPTLDGDPVNMLTGEFYHEENPDFILPGNGFDLSLKRTYYSQLIYDGPFGYGWAWSHCERLLKLEAEEDEESEDYGKERILYYTPESGTPYKIVINSDGTYQYPDGAYFELVNTGNGYKIINRDQSFYTFDIDGKLLEKQDTFGNTIGIVYRTDKPELPQKIQTWQNDDTTKTTHLTFSYNSNNKINKVTDLSGNFCTYTYDESDLTSVIDLAGNTTSYAYLKNQDNPANDHNMTRCTLPEGGGLTIGYYKNDQVAYHKNDRGDVFNFQYSRINLFSETWNEEGYYRKVYFNEDNDVIRVDNKDKTLETKAYDEHHNMISHTDGNGNTTTYQYYPEGGDPSIASMRNLYVKKQVVKNPVTGTSQEEITRYKYDSPYSPHYPSEITDPEGNITRLVYNKNGSLKEKIQLPGYEMTENGEIVAKDGAPGFVTRYYYDSFGNLLTILDPEGNATSGEYTDDGLFINNAIDKNGNVTGYAFSETSTAKHPRGTLAAKTDPEGNTTTFEYNKYNQLTSEIDPVNNSSTVSYNANRKKKTETDRRDATTYYSYDPLVRDLVAGADLIETKDTYGHSETYEYDRLGNITKKTDRLGNSTHYQYDRENRIIAETDALGNTERYEYDGNGNIIKKTDKNGNITETVYDSANRPVKITDGAGNVTLYTYDLRGNKQTETNPDNITTKYEYDKLNRMVRKIVGYGADAASCTYGEREYLYGYDASGRLIKETFPKGSATRYEYDGNGNKTAVLHLASDGYEITRETFEYNGNNQIVAREDGKGNRTEFEYDALGRKTAEIDALGNRTEFGYDAVGNLVAEIDKNGNTTKHEYDLLNRKTKDIDTLGNETVYQYDDNGNLTTTIDSLGRETWFYYDALNRKIAVEDSDGNITTTDYDAVGNVVCVTDARGNSTRTVYDGANRPVKKIDPKGNFVEIDYNGIDDSTYTETSGRVVVTTEKDADGNVIMVSKAEYFDPLGLQTGQITAYNTGLETTVSTCYDGNGNKSWARNEKGVETEYQYDDMNRLVLKTEAYDAATTESDKNVKTAFGYDSAGNLVWVTNPNGNTVLMGYDKLNRRIIETDAFDINTDDLIPDLMIRDAGFFDSYEPYREVVYDANSNPLFVIKRNGDRIRNRYDELNRKTDVYLQFHGVTTEVQQQSFMYDALSRLTASFDFNSGTITHKTEYDNYTALNQHETEIQDETWTISKTFDENGNTTEVTYPSGTIVNRTYDKINRLHTIHDSGSLVAEVTEYNSRGEMITAAFGNGMTLSMDYDVKGRETDRHYRSVTNATLFRQKTTEYDLRSNVVSETVTGLSTINKTYTYDHLDRLTDHTRSDQTLDKLWRYDAIGNWLETNQNTLGETRQVNTDNEYTTITGMTPVYDDNGNLISDGSKTYIYDWANRLIRVENQSDGSEIAAYTYDAENRRRTRSVRNISGFFDLTQYVYDGGQVLEEYFDSTDDTKDKTLTYIYGSGIDNPVMLKTGGQSYYYIKDRLFSVTALTSSSGDITERYDYSPYGLMTITDSLGAPLGESSVGNTFGFTGRRWDAESGLWHYRNRAYSPVLGRFMQRDPAGYVDGLNLYAYVRNNPVMLIDPWGLTPKINQNAYDDMNFFSAQIESDTTNSYDRTCRMIQGCGRSVHDFFQPKSKALFDYYAPIADHTAAMARGVVHDTGLDRLDQGLYDTGVYTLGATALMLSYATWAASGTALATIEGYGFTALEGAGFWSTSYGAGTGVFLANNMNNIDNFINGLMPDPPAPNIWSARGWAVNAGYEKLAFLDEQYDLTYYIGHAPEHFMYMFGESEKQTWNDIKMIANYAYEEWSKPSHTDAYWLRNYPKAFPEFQVE